MYKVGIIGNSIDDFKDHDSIINKINNTISLLSYQYGKDLIIEISSSVGVGGWAAEFCIANDIKYNLIMPFPAEFFKDIWYKHQNEQLKNWVEHSSSMFIASSKPNKNSFISAYNQIVDDCNFVVYFWSGKKQGLTYESIKNSLHKNKLSLNAFEDLKLMTQHDLNK